VQLGKINLKCVYLSAMHIYRHISAFGLFCIFH